VLNLKKLLLEKYIIIFLKATQNCLEGPGLPTTALAYKSYFQIGVFIITYFFKAIDIIFYFKLSIILYYFISYYPLKIIVACGRPYTPSDVLDDGKSVYGTVPWSVGLYRKNNSHCDGYYELICGGTLITPNLVISGIKKKFAIKHISTKNINNNILI